MSNPDKSRYKRKSVFLGFKDGIAGVTAGASTGVGAAPEAEAGSLSAVGLHMDADDEHDWYWVLPRDLNPAHEIGFRVRYSSASATAADNHDWILLYDIIAEDAALAIGTTALDTPIASDTDNGTANAWQDSPRGTLDGDTVTISNVTNQDLMALNLELDVDDASEEMNMYGLIIDYVPKRNLGQPQDWNPSFDQELM